MTGTKISVVMPTYNGSQFLREAVESAFAQSTRPCEIIIADDCSRDDTLAAAKELAADAPVPVTTMRMPRNTGGPAGPLNAAIEAACGEWIAVLEQDDAMRPDRLERQLAALVAYPHSRFCGARSCRLGSNGDTSGFFWGAAEQFRDVVDDAVLRDQPEHFLASGATAFRVLLDRQFLLTNSAYLFHKSLWREVGGFDRGAGSCADVAFALSAAAKSDLAIVNVPVIEHRLHAASLNRRDPELAILKGLLVRLQYARRFPQLALDEWRIIYWRLRAGAMGALWRAGQYRDVARLAFELGWRRLGRQWQS